MSTERKDYFDYATDVLGIKSILMDMDAVKVMQVALLIAVDHYATYSIEEKDLLAKMIAALKLDLKQMQLCDATEVAGFQPRFTLHFTDGYRPQPQATGTSVTTFSPRDLLKNADNKKAAWTDLQQVMAYFK